MHDGGQPGPSVVLGLKVINPDDGAASEPTKALEAAVKPLAGRDYAAGLLADWATTSHEYTTLLGGNLCRVRLVPRSGLIAQP
jgi:hypothetical protein